MRFRLPIILGQALGWLGPLRNFANRSLSVIVHKGLRRGRRYTTPITQALPSFGKRIGVVIHGNYVDIKRNPVGFLYRIVILASIFLFCLLVLEFARGKAMFRPVVPRKPRRETVKVSSQRPRPLAHYSGQVAARQLFAPSQGYGTPAASPGSDGSRVRLAELAQNLVLLGISLGREPEAIIEDKTTNTTHFLKVGESLGQVRVESIAKGRVILSCGGEKLELVL